VEEKALLDTQNATHEFENSSNSPVTTPTSFRSLHRA